MGSETVNNDSWSAQPGQTRNKAILLTAPGTAAIAVVRLVGPGAAAFLQKHFPRAVRPGRAVHGELVNGQKVIDDPVVVVTDDGQCADINLHGGTWIVRSVLDLARRQGFEVVERLPMPLPEEAVDPLDPGNPLESEVLTHLPLARSELGVRTLLAQPRAWREYLANPGPFAPSPQEILDDRSLRWLLHPPRVAITGAPNAGKSTLANQLFAQERAITADLPGTTRDWIGEIANIDGLPVMLVDTPGLRQTDNAIESEAIARSGEQVGQADLVLLVLDVSRPLEPEQVPLMKAFPAALHVLNKSDQPHAWKLQQTLCVHTVAITGAGVDCLRREIQRRFQCLQPDPYRPRWWTDRQRVLLEQARAEPQRLQQMIQAPVPESR
jgi:small GTP-binding protein